MAPPAVTAVAGKFNSVIAFDEGVEIGNTDVEATIDTGCWGKSLKLLLGIVETALTGNGPTCKGECCCELDDTVCCCIPWCITVKVANDLLSFIGCWKDFPRQTVVLLDSVLAAFRPLSVVKSRPRAATLELSNFFFH